MKCMAVLALLALFLAVGEATKYKCVKDDKSCTAVEVCEKPRPEKCGNDWCEFPYVCKTKTKTLCKDFVAYKKRCGEPRKVCKKILNPCGDGGLKCEFNEECVKDTVCNEVPLPPADDGTLGGSIRSSVQNLIDSVFASVSVSTGFNIQPARHTTQTKCNDKFQCIRKDPCRKVVVKKCIPSRMRENTRYGDWRFSWENEWENDYERCGRVTCDFGYRCADVIVKDCDVYDYHECGKDWCHPGEECTDVTLCKDFPFVSTVCEDADVPVCVKLPSDWQEYYRPPCKTTYRCDNTGTSCGNDWCERGSVCAVHY